MRTGRAAVSQTRPEAHGICDRCQFRFLHRDLSWQMQWRGTQLQNIRLLVCDSCKDKPNEQLRTIVLPPDPIPIMNARPENYMNADNPMSAIGVSANFQQPTYGSRIGNLIGGGGINAAFDGNAYKPSWMCARNSISNSSYNNYVGINWSGINTTVLNLPPDMGPPIIRHSLTSFTITAPNDRSFVGTTSVGYVVQSSPVDIPVYGAWTTVSSGTTAGTAGEEISGDCSANGEYQFHRVAFYGDQINYVAVAQVAFSVAQAGEISVGGSS